MAVTPAETQLASVFRGELMEEIDKRTQKLITTTNERDAGYIQGMRGALLLLEALYRNKADEPRSTESRPVTL